MNNRLKLMKQREEENMIQHETNETWAAALDPQHLQKLETDVSFRCCFC